MGLDDLFCIWHLKDVVLVVCFLIILNHFSMQNCITFIFKHISKIGLIVLTGASSLRKNKRIILLDRHRAYELFSFVGK